MKKRLLTIILAFAGIVAAAQSLPRWTEGCLDIHAIATGKGENTLIIYPDGTTMLVDCGDMGDVWKGERVPDGSLTPGEWVARYIEHFTGSAHLDRFLLTHFHADHFGNPKAFRPGTHGYGLAGISQVAEEIKIDKFIDRGYPSYDFPTADYRTKASGLDNYATFVEYQVANGAKAEKFQIGSHRQLGMIYEPRKYDLDVWNIACDGRITTGHGSKSRPMYPDTADPAGFDENMFSNVFLLRYGKFTYYCGGDLGGCTWPKVSSIDRNFESAVADAICASGMLSDGKGITVLKADHHGTRDSSNPDFLWKMRPQNIVFHAFEDKHTWSDTIRRMLDVQMPGCKNLYTTGERGYVLLDEELQQKIHPAGHIVIRVYPGGGSYQIFVLDYHDREYSILECSDVIEL